MPKISRPDWLSRRVLAWAFYDWANSAFATTVMAGFFPAFLKNYWAADLPRTTSTFQLGFVNSAASLVIVVAAPVLGAIADRGGSRKKFLVFFTYMGVLAAAGLYFVSSGQWLAALVLYGLGVIGFSGGNVFYDSLLLGVAPKGKLDAVSGLGYAMGYLGGFILFVVNILMYQYPATFGLDGPSHAIRVAFVMVAVWWAVFALPVIFLVEEPVSPKRVAGFAAVSSGLRQLRQTFREIRKLRMVFLFLLGYWLYIDGVDTIVRMAVDYGMSIGFQQGDLLTALLLTQVIGFPAALAFGLIGEKLGPKTGIFICIGVYFFVTIWAYFIDTVGQFYGIACAVGLVQGGIQALSRSYYGRLIPPSQTAEFYGFYNMLGKFAAVVGPSMMGTVGLLTGDPRLSILSLIVLFAGGGAILYFVDEEQARKGAMALEERARKAPSVVS